MTFNDAPSGLYRAPSPPPPAPSVSVLDAFGYGFGLLRAQPGVVLTLAVLVLIPILGPISIAGMQAFLFQRLVRRDTSPLPPLGASDLGVLFKRGLPSFLGQLAVSAVLMVFFMVPMIGVPVAVATNDTGAMVVVGVFSLLAFTGAMLLGNVLLHAVLTRAEATEDVEATFALPQVWDYGRRTWVTIVLGMPLFGFLTILLVMAGMLFFVVGMYAAVVVLQLAAVHYRWQVYERFVWEGGQPLPVVGAPQTMAPPVSWQPSNGFPRAGQG